MCRNNNEPRADGARKSCVNRQEREDDVGKMTQRSRSGMEKQEQERDLM